MRLTPKYLTTHQSEESLQADQALLFEPHSPLEVGAHSLEAVTPLWPPLPGKAIKLFFRFLKILGSSRCGAVLMNPTRNEEILDSIPGLAQ